MCTNIFKKHGTTQPEKIISVNELKDTFSSLKINKDTGYECCKNVLEFYINLCYTYLIFLYKLVFFQMNSKLPGLHHYLKEVKTMNSETTDLYLCYRASEKFWKKLFIILFTSILLTIAYFTKSSLVFMKDIPLKMQFFN